MNNEFFFLFNLKFSRFNFLFIDSLLILFYAFAMGAENEFEEMDNAIYFCWGIINDEWLS